MSDTEPPLIILRHSVDYPSKQAHTVQMTHAARGLADAGAEVWLSVRKLTVESAEQAWASYGVEPHPRVRLLQWPHWTRGLRTWKGGLFHLLLRRKLRVHRGRRPVLYFRDKAANFETILDLQDELAALNARIVLESHTRQEDYLEQRMRDAMDDAARAALQHSKWARNAELEHAAVKAADLFVAVSQGLVTRICESAGRTGPTAVVRNGAPAPGEDRPLADRSGIVYLGHAYEVKGVDDLVAALAHLPGAALKIVGCRNDEEKEKVMGWARAHGVAERVTITGHVPNAEVPSHLLKARVAVIPQKGGDGSPMKAFEYMAAGLPIVATDVPANAEIIKESNAGVLVPPLDPPALAEQLKRFLEDDALAERHRQAALKWITNNTWQKRGERVLKLLQDIPAPDDLKP